MKFVGTQETVEKILWHIQKKTPGLYVRYGDGDFFILNGGEEQLCKATPEFQADMKKSIESCTESDLFGCNFHCEKLGTVEPGMRWGVFELEDKDVDPMIKDIQTYRSSNQSLYSAVALHYAMCFKPDLFFTVLERIQQNGKTILLHSNKFNKEKLEFWFGPFHSITAPAKQSYDAKANVCASFEKVLEGIEGFHVCILALGCGGRAMLPDLRNCIQKSKKDIFILDFGSPIDLLMEETTRHWISMVPSLPGILSWLEKNIEDLHDELTS